MTDNVKGPAVKRGIAGEPPVPAAERRRQALRENILKVSMKLFFEQGYRRTTARQIAQRSGILLGSLYNSFSNKEEIFEVILLRAYDEALEKSHELLTDENDLVTAVSFPIALVLYASYRSGRSAEMLHEALSSQKILSGLIDRTFDWMTAHLSRYSIVTDDHHMHLSILAIMGCINNLIPRCPEEYDNYRESLRISLEIFCALFKMPAYNIESIADRVSETIESGDIVICDMKI